MTSLFTYVMVGGLSVIAFVAACFVATVKKMITDEMRERLDRSPAWLVALALRVVTPDLRESKRIEWMDHLLIAFDERNAGLPFKRLVLTIPFVLPLMGIAAQTRLVAARSRFNSWATRQGEPPHEPMEHAVPPPKSIVLPALLKMRVDGRLKTFATVNYDAQVEKIVANEGLGAAESDRLRAVVRAMWIREGVEYLRE